MVWNGIASLNEVSTKTSVGLECSVTFKDDISITDELLGVGFVL